MSRTDTPATTPTPTRRPRAATAIGVLGAIGVAGSAVMAIAHLDLSLALAAGFGLGVVLFGAATYGALRQTAWAWPVATVVNAIALAGSVMPWRGLERSGLPALITVVALGLLFARPGRDALLYRR